LLQRELGWVAEGEASGEPTADEQRLERAIPAGWMQGMGLAV
jgi:hypothetical protein